eukprot:2545962-Prymnesium_polylepis.1
MPACARAHVIRGNNAQRHTEGRCPSLYLASPRPTDAWQANPYLYEDAAGETRIDLSGSGGHSDEPMLMGADISVLYSLPSMVAGAQDADGLCTVQLCNVLSAAHNELMAVLQASSTALLPRAALAAGAALPTISYQTPPEVMRQQLLAYEPSRDLLPLLAAYRVEGGAKGKG